MLRDGRSLVRVTLCWSTHAHISLGFIRSVATTRRQLHPEDSRGSLAFIRSQYAMHKRLGYSTKHSRGKSNVLLGHPLPVLQQNSHCTQRQHLLLPALNLNLLDDIHPAATKRLRFENHLAASLDAPDAPERVDLALRAFVRVVTIGPGGGAQFADVPTGLERSGGGGGIDIAVEGKDASLDAGHGRGRGCE
ncbi:hypothetical protein BXZ70DRAFT_121255 [Cristinia sonorae]|uniref:Uncharacterized protein n=1 Tax=Cristinia sonorae TaxID=1940300 RepID=A0A8K0XQD2_9AGAR|nr:hypothetical protein BXZ70DRAFT_121255 [Cristinia sonorae]